MHCPEPHGYGCPCRRCTLALAVPLSPTVLRAALRQSYPLTERPGPCQQTWDYLVFRVKNWAHDQLAASLRPLLRDWYRLRWDRDLRSDIVGSFVVLAVLGWVAMCSPVVR